MEEKVFQLIKDYHDKTNGKCGLLIVTIQNELKTDYETLRNILKKLHADKKIKVREGINGKLIFKK